MPILRHALGAVTAALLATGAVAHHGIIFTADEQVSVTGTVVKEMTGNPHFEIWVQESETRWAIDLANPYRIKKAGLAWDGSDLPVGREITVIGFPALDPETKVIQARSIVIDGEPHVLFDEDEPKY